MSTNAQFGARSGKPARPFSWSSYWKRFLYCDPSRRPRRNGYARLRVETLEDRTLLSSIFGNVFNDISGTGLPQANPPLASQVVYLDLNNDGKFDSTVNNVGGASGLIDLTGSLGVPSFISVISVGILPQQVQDVAVTVDVSDNTSAPMQVILFSPTGLSGLLGAGIVQRALLRVARFNRGRISSAPSMATPRTPSRRRRSRSPTAPMRRRSPSAPRKPSSTA